LATICAVLLLPILRVAPAGAAAPTMSSSGTHRDCVKTNLAGCGPRGTVSAGRTVTMHCWKLGTEATGEYTSDKYFYVTVGGTNQKGYVHSSRVVNQTPNTPECGTHRGIATATWAAQHVGISQTTSAERSAIPTTTSYWAGYCATFTYASTKLGAGYTPRYAGDARPRYDNYANAGRVTTSGEPNIGAHVFWRNVTSFGHTAIYVGNGAVVSTRGTPGGTAVIERVSLTATFGGPTGWVNPGNL
jgi:hypothetical protein